MQVENGTAALPQFYRSVVPLMSKAHRKLVFDAESGDVGFARDSSAIPLVVEEFIAAQASYPIVFTQGADPVPVVLTALPGLPNRHVDDAGRWRSGTYVPAYVRRYPFLLAKLDEGAADLTLCFDAESARLRAAEGSDGNLFEGDEPTPLAREALAFCERFEAAAQRTLAFSKELAELDLFMEAQASLEGEDGMPRTLRGFQMVSEEKVKQLRGDQARRLLQSGALALIFAHFFSLRNLDALLRDAALPGSGNVTTKGLGDLGEQDAA